MPKAEAEGPCPEVDGGGAQSFRPVGSLLALEIWRCPGLTLLTSRLNRVHEPVHLDIPVFHVGAGLVQLPLGSL